MPDIYTESDHCIDRKSVDKDALTVIHRLRDAGFSAYLVGGGVRDLLLGQHPKDFDISTSARPEQIKKLFGRQCLLIGRRFRLAHIRFGHKVLEVATFRAGEMSEDLIVHDNEWGSEEEDVLRRDFTINGLLYDPESHTVIDHVGGWKDIRAKVLRSIGEAEVRFRQDPVRMLRLLKFQARFNFSVDDKDLNALRICRTEILKSSPARILEELLRMLESTAAAPFLRLMLEQGLIDLLYPAIGKELREEKGSEMFRFLEAADHENRKAVQYPIERPILIAALLYPIFERELRMRHQENAIGGNPNEILNLTYEVIHNKITSSFSHFPKRLAALTAYVLMSQARLTPLVIKKQHPIRLFKTREFTMALRLLKLRSMVYPSLKDGYLAWRDQYKQFLDQEDHHQSPPPLVKKRRPKRR